MAPGSHTGSERVQGYDTSVQLDPNPNAEYDPAVAGGCSTICWLAGDNVKAIGDAGDPFGGIGRNGAQRTPGVMQEMLHSPRTKYTFQSGKVTNLDGSNGPIKGHGDVTNEAVTYAFASAVAQT